MLVCTLNSAVASGDGTKLRLLGCVVSVPVFGTPSSRNSLVKPRPPLIWKLSMPPLSNGRFERLASAGVYCTPGDSCASEKGLRPSSGRSATCSRLITWPRLALLVSSSGTSELHRHFFGHRAELHRQIEAQAIADPHLDALPLAWSRTRSSVAVSV